MYSTSTGRKPIAGRFAASRAVFDPKGFRCAIIVVHGVYREITLADFHVHEYHYPWQPGASFECSDTGLNNIYRAGIRPVALNSWDAFIDAMLKGVHIPNWDVEKEIVIAEPFMSYVVHDEVS